MLNVGDKVKYTDIKDNQIKSGVVHGVRTRERVNGDGTTTITSKTYLIDTGNPGFGNNPELIEMRIKE